MGDNRGEKGILGFRNFMSCHESLPTPVNLNNCYRIIGLTLSLHITTFSLFFSLFLLKNYFILNETKINIFYNKMYNSPRR